MDNAQQRKQCLPRRISFAAKKSRNFKTIDYIQREPYKKFTPTEISLHKRKQSHPLLTENNHRKIIERKIKSLTKYELRNVGAENNYLRRGQNHSEQNSTAIQNLIRKNSKILKFTLSKEREKLSSTLSKQKYKRSELMKTIIDHRKISQGKYREKQNTNKLVKNKNSQSKLQEVIEIRKKSVQLFKIKDINLSEIAFQDGDLQQIFVEGFSLFMQSTKNENKTIFQNAKNEGLEEELKQLQDAKHLFKSIYNEVGELSIKNLIMIGLCNFSEKQYDEAIMYLSKGFQKANGNLFLIKLASESLNNHFILSSYFKLARAYQQTNNYLCAINVISKWEHFQQKMQHANQQAKHWQVNQQANHRQVNQKEQYYTIQSPNNKNHERALEKHYRKKSHLTPFMNPQQKMKKYNSTHNYSSVELNQLHSRIDRSERINTIGEDTIQRESSEKDTKDNHDNNENSQWKAQIYLIRARMYLMIKDYERAAEDYRKCLKLNNIAMEAHLELASTYYIMKETRKALYLLDEILHKQSLHQEDTTQKRELDQAYVFYHKALIYWHQGKFQESLKQLNQIKVKELQSEACHYKALILMKNLHQPSRHSGAKDEVNNEANGEVNNHANDEVNNEAKNELNNEDRNKRVDEILMELQKSISSASSSAYVCKSYYYKILMLLNEKRDYYGAQYEVDRMNKVSRIEMYSNSAPIIQNYSRISKVYEETSNFISNPSQCPSLCQEHKIKGSSKTQELHFQVLFKLIQAIICVLKMKLNKGLSLLKEISFDLVSEKIVLKDKFGEYYWEIIKAVHQFKFYSYYMVRNYEQALKHVNRLLDVMRCRHSQPQYHLEVKLVIVNKLMLQCMILINQTKYNFALAKITEIQQLIAGHPQHQEMFKLQPFTYIQNNISIVKSICYISLYSQANQSKTYTNHNHEAQVSHQESNREILLSAQELLMHCLITDKQNSLLFYLISVIHYELGEHESSLKYIRQALELSDDHMIKHYYCKANTKLMLARYDESIKDYSNAIIVYKEQQTINRLQPHLQDNQQSSFKTNLPLQDPLKDPVKDHLALKDPKANLAAVKGNLVSSPLRVENDEDDYYQEKQVMISEIYYNRAVALLKQAYQLSQFANYGQHAGVICANKERAVQDLTKYFGMVFSEPIPQDIPLIKNRLLLFMHTEDPSQILSVLKKNQLLNSYLSDQDVIKVFYLVKELNNCITSIKNYIAKSQTHEKQRLLQQKKQFFPPKTKKDPIQLQKHRKEELEEELEMEKISKLRFDLRCLEALKKSSTKTVEAIESSLILLLEITQEIYKKKEDDIKQYTKTKQYGKSNIETSCLEELFEDSCGQFFKWSDLLFFIGVMHYELKEYETAIKYFEESLHEKKTSGTLYSLSKYTKPINKSYDKNDQCRYFELENLFQNRVYCQEEIQYNIGVCYLMLNKSKKAYQYLMNYSPFLILLKNQIAENQQKRQDYLGLQPELQEGGFQEQGEGGLQGQTVFYDMITPKMSTKNLIKIEDQSLVNSSLKKSIEIGHKNNKESRHKNSKDRLKRQFSVENSQERSSEQSEGQDEKQKNITPFPTHNRLCSIYTPQAFGDKHVYLSFCLPKIDIPLMNLFKPNEIEMASIYNPLSCQSKEEEEISQSSINSKTDHEPITFPIEKEALPNIIHTISLLDIEMKPIAPWIKQSATGVIFTDCLTNQSIEIQTARLSESTHKKSKDLKVDGALLAKLKLGDDHIEDIFSKQNNKKSRYAEYEIKQQVRRV